MADADGTEPWSGPETRSGVTLRQVGAAPNFEPVEEAVADCTDVGVDEHNSLTQETHFDRPLSARRRGIQVHSCLQADRRQRRLEQGRMPSPPARQHRDAAQQGALHAGERYRRRDRSCPQS